MPRRCCSILPVVAILATSSCTHGPVAADPAFEAVRLTPRPPGPECQQRGAVVGKGARGFFGQNSVRDVVLESLDDLRRKAIAIRANYVQHEPPQVDGDALVFGVAYYCPERSSRVNEDGGATQSQSE